MKKLKTSLLVLVLTSSIAVTNAQQKKDTMKTKEIEGVVVTALGIKREKKSLGYASQEVKSSELFGGTTNTGNIASQLSGKVAGLNVTSTSNFGGSSNLVIRGIKSLGGSNPLVVIDGSPVNNSTTSFGNENGGFDLGNALSDINQEDIESVNVLKGAAASALYGERGLNGVIVITTKNGKGKQDDSWGVTLSSSVQAGFIDKSTFAKYQDRYGAGYDPSFYYGTGPGGKKNANFGEDASWGPEFNPNLLVYQWDSFDPTSPNYKKATPWVAAKNGPLKFFETPMSFINSISLSKGSKGFNFNLTYDNNLSNGLLPNSDLRKNTISTKINYDLNSKLHATVYSTLTIQGTTGRTETGYNDNIVTGFRQWWQTNVDLVALKNAYINNVGNPTVDNNYGNVTWNRISASNGRPAFWNNPYFQRYQNYSTDDRTRTFSYVQLTYDVDDHINITGKLSYDNTNLVFERRLAEGSYPQRFGVSGKAIGSGYHRYDLKRSEINYDLFANYKYDLTSWLNISGIVGGNVRRNRQSSIEASTEGGLIKRGYYSLDNSKAPLLNPVEFEATVQTNSLYATASFDFNKVFYLDGTIRRDVTSTLPNGNNKYTYGSISGSVILSELLKTQKSVMNFWKVRGNYAEVGGTADSYQLKYSYYTAGYFNTGNGNINIYRPQTILKNENLKPQRSREFEFGTEVHFLRDRIIFDGAYYDTKTFDQLITPDISAGSGKLAAAINAGQINNKGVELHLGVNPIRTTDFSWDIDVNWARNRNKVVSLEEGLQVYQLVGLVGGASIVASVGNQWGDIYGKDYVYLNGEKVVDPTTGYYLTEKNKVIGNVQAKWTGGIRNSFRYKNLSLSFLIDVRKGGDVFSSDMYYGLGSGLFPETAVDGYRTNIPILEGVNPNGQRNTTPVNAAAINPLEYGNNPYDGYAIVPDKRFVYDGSFVKLREASITYSFPKSVLANTFMNEAKVSIIGRNLWIIHKNLPYADPESSQMGGLYSYGSSVGALPTTRELGVNFTFKF
ncbi:SusC/RagA family TonB-linked outer membrane protein [Chryseobacterium sp. PMSZPI]|uniref:SusC/RagA family TonB-linked outer membrane protein n=1 Tax=Chryseobacterium sp. PMSZPI TaxID=1033900 RepID=UPI000C333517|nr:SusC/RagA family TonB-linked outer membrane protein [Chryseobacterium sp. PMSZPI]PKF74522.1 SusC/RagA family TonB-linked outer membrane protein [Chryseobacterium sp. PMSZPI]